MRLVTDEVVPARAPWSGVVPGGVVGTAVRAHLLEGPAAEDGPHAAAE